MSFQFLSELTKISNNAQEDVDLTPLVHPDVTDWLVVDLDFSFIKVDSLVECYIYLFKTNPWSTLKLLLVLRKGIAWFKRSVAEAIDPEDLRFPLNLHVLNLIEEERQKGFKVLLATGADRKIAKKVFEQYGVFDEFISSDGSVNLVGNAKLSAIKNKIGTGKFTYIGDSAKDLPIWKQSERAIVVHPTSSLKRKLKNEKIDFVTVELAPFNTLKALFKSIRVHQWSKNTLVFVPLITSHGFYSLEYLKNGLAAFAAFSFCSSGVYLINDTIDVFDDRKHSEKKFRPLAAGDLTAGAAVKSAILMTAIGLGIAAASHPILGYLLALYLALTGLYTVELKRWALADVFLLSGFYVLRVVCGGVSMGIQISYWLTAFTLFFFLSLAFAKRFAELDKNVKDGKLLTPGRGYQKSDLQVLSMLGVGSGVMAVSILAFYIHSEQGTRIYSNTTILWPVIAIVFYWLARIWLFAHRGTLQHDPVVFALKDSASYILGFIVGLLLFLSK